MFENEEDEYQLIQDKIEAQRRLLQRKNNNKEEAFLESNYPNFKPIGLRNEAASSEQDQVEPEKGGLIISETTL